MKKKLSVIISVICIIVSLGSISGTLYYAKNHNTSSMMQQAGGTPPSMPNKGENSQNNESINKIHLKTTKVAMINQIHKTKI